MRKFLTYLSVALAVYVIWKSPAAASAGLGELGHAFAALGNGVEAILSAVTGKPG
jgi:hypothetical protein